MGSGGSNYVGMGAGIIGGIGGAFMEQESVIADRAMMKEEMRRNKLFANAEEERIREVYGELAGEQQVAYAKAGVVTDTGTPLVVRARTAEDRELEILNIKYQADLANKDIGWQRERRSEEGKKAMWSSVLQGFGAAASYTGSTGKGSSRPAVNGGGNVPTRPGTSIGGKGSVDGITGGTG